MNPTSKSGRKNQIKEEEKNLKQGEEKYVKIYKKYMFETFLYFF